jgi:aspartyl/asparaginyl-tRNA synthetase
MPEDPIVPAAPAASAPPQVVVATIATLGQHEGQSVTLRGWLYNLRESGKLLFPIFRDGTGTIQGVAHVKSVSPAVFEALKGLTQESSVIVTGKVRADKRAPGGFELDVEDLEVVSPIPTRSRSRNTASISSWSTAICGFAPRARRPFCASARRSCVRLRNISIRTASSAPIRPF